MHRHYPVTLSKLPYLCFQNTKHYAEMSILTGWSTSCFLFCFICSVVQGVKRAVFALQCPITGSPCVMNLHFLWYLIYKAYLYSFRILIDLVIFELKKNVENFNDWSRCFTIKNSSKVQFGPAHELLVLIASASSEGSDESVHTRSLVRVFTSRIFISWR